jgi:dephospho-CoA kinase
MSAYIVGLTGGIGSGKSAVSNLFEKKGISIVDADLVSRQIVEPGTSALTQIAQHFGSDILDQDGKLNRSKLRNIIFNNDEDKNWLEHLLHPLINKEIRRQLNDCNSQYAILSSPLLLETHQYKLVDRILVVDATEELQIQRAMLRDNNNLELIKSIMNSQMNRQDRCARANDIIQNHGEMDELNAQVEKYHQLYLELSE